LDLYTEVIRPSWSPFPVQRLLGVDELDGRLAEAVKRASVASFHHLLLPQGFALPGRERAPTGIAAEMVLQARQHVVERDASVVHHVGRQQAHLQRHGLLDDEERDD
jgi:hypothetical protein